MAWRVWMVVLVCGGCGADVDAEVAPAMPRMRTAVVPAGSVGPVVLFPRHRVLSGMPTIQVAVVADPGSVEVELVVGQGPSRRRRLWRTRRRVIPWPQGWGALEVGERGLIRVTSCGRTDVAPFERAPRLPVDLRWRSARSGARWLLSNGLPMEALRLIATDPTGAPHLRTEALIRAGFPVAGQWLVP